MDVKSLKNPFPDSAEGEDREGNIACTARNNPAGHTDDSGKGWDAIPQSQTAPGGKGNAVG